MKNRKYAASALYSGFLPRLLLNCTIIARFMIDEGGVQGFGGAWIELLPE
jgi:hypothetical protein